MTIIGLSDLHGRLDLSPGAEGIIARADLLLLAGDITHFEGAGAARKMVERLRSIQPSVLAVPGNCDHPDVIRFLEEEGISLHGRGRPVGEIWVYGAGGSLAGPLNTPLSSPTRNSPPFWGRGSPESGNPLPGGGPPAPLPHQGGSCLRDEACGEPGGADFPSGKPSPGLSLRPHP